MMTSLEDTKCPSVCVFSKCVCLIEGTIGVAKLVA